MVVFFLFSFYFRFSSSWHPFPPSSIPHQSLLFLIIPIFFFFYLPSHFFSSEAGGTCTWRNGQIRFTRRTRRGRDGISFLPWKKKKKPHLFVSLKQTLFSYIAQGSFSFPTFSFSSNCISLRLFVPDERYLFLSYISSFISPPPLLSSHPSISRLSSILHTIHYTYSPAPIIISLIPTYPTYKQYRTTQPSPFSTACFLRSTRKYSPPPAPIASCPPLIQTRIHKIFSLFIKKERENLKKL